MKKIITLALTTLLAFNANAKWEASITGVIAEASINGDDSWVASEDGKNYWFGANPGHNNQISPYEVVLNVQGTKVRMSFSCYEGACFFQSVTSAGQSYINKVVNSGKPFELEGVWFENKGKAQALKDLAELQKAL